MQAGRLWQNRAVGITMRQFDQMKRMMRLAATNPQAVSRHLTGNRGPVRYGAKRRGR